MSIAVRTYSELLDRIEAMAGKDSFTTAEQTRILSLVNARLYSAYRRCDYWPRYFYVSEARFCDADTVAYTQDSAVLVSGAGTDDANGLYQPVPGLAAGERRWYMNGDSDSYYIQEAGMFANFTLSDPSTNTLYSSDTGSEPFDVAWNVIDGASPAPTVTESTRANIDTFFRLFTGPMYGTSPSGCELDFYVDDEGAHTTSTTTSYDQLYVTYKAPWDGPYAADSTSIPIEFFDYAAHGVLSDWLRSSGNFEQAGAEAREAEAMLNFELMRKQVQYNAQMYAPRYRTYISQQARNY